MKIRGNLFWIWLPVTAILMQAFSGGAQSVTTIAGGGYHTLFIESGGSLWTTGFGAYGELGDGSNNTTNRPRQILSSGVTAIAGGEYYSLFIKSDGSLWGMGANALGELGNGSDNNTNQPTLIVDANVTSIAAGQYHSLFTKSDGSLWGIGYDFYGELGDGRYFTNYPYGTNRPQEILDTGVKTVASGDGFSLFLKTDGSLWGMGFNAFGALGDGSTNNTDRPEEITPGNVTAIAAGLEHSLYIMSDS